MQFSERWWWTLFFHRQINFDFLFFVHLILERKCYKMEEAMRVKKKPRGEQSADHMKHMKTVEIKP